MTGQWEAGRELDAEIARTTFNRDVRLVFRSHEIGDDYFQWKKGVQVGGEWVPGYSTDIAAAWTIIEHIRTLIFSKRMRFANALREQARVPGSGEQIEWPYALMFFGREGNDLPTFPLAICRAASAIGGGE